MLMMMAAQPCTAWAINPRGPAVHGGVPGQILWISGWPTLFPGSLLLPLAMPRCMDMACMQEWCDL